ncbi:hypothetical protein [Jiangella anatolica]|uniref:Uncharacterized protein n=1 Tax=Jiangella anatolica TaxID=2670374 RepID=A0A2W2BRZ4_9ACTN|nr:hypothetical protein [Jiangella anatolica]PZF83214.1 hypothetical protein C1I92_13130 [Jiangella anatolica]
MAALLDQDWSEDLDSLVDQVLSLAYQMRDEREEHGLLFSQDGLWLVVRGFTTPLQAERWGTKAGLEPGQAVLAIIKTGDQV